MNSTASIEEIKTEAARLLAKGQLSELEFLTFAHTATKSALEHWDLHENIAYYAADVWLRQDGLSPAVYDAGGKFADLELPDAHVVTEKERIPIDIPTPLI